MPTANAADHAWIPATRYPDQRVRVLDARFERYVVHLAAVERIACGMRWTEGPVWFGDGRYLLFSDIPNNRIMRWDEETGAVSVFRKPSNWANGNTRDRQGRLITCEHGRRVTRTEIDGTITVLADQHGGKPLNSPNDVVVKSDGSIWFTDPPFGISGNYLGQAAKAEVPQNVYRLDGETGEITVLADDVMGPNGLCFSPDESVLYLVEARGSAAAERPVLHALTKGPASAGPFSSYDGVGHRITATPFVRAPVPVHTWRRTQSTNPNTNGTDEPA